MKIFYFIILILICSCSIEPSNEIDDNAILNSLLELSDYPQPTRCIDLPDSVCVSEEGRITLLNLFNFNLVGEIPETIGELSELKILGLKSNNLIGNIPDNIGNLTKLVQLNLSNNSLEGFIPESISNLKNLIILNLSNNFLQGNIPDNLTQLSALLSLDLGNNYLTGTINPNLCKIEKINISFNQLCGLHPYCIDKPKLIGYQDCTCSDVTKYINGYCYSINDLNFLDSIINNSALINPNLDVDSSGSIEALELGKQVWQSTRLKELDCYWENDSCNVSAEIPNNISELDSLNYLDLQNNSITGNLPEAIIELTNLNYINLSNNQIVGTISSQICNQDSSREIIINNNNICPCYPNCVQGVEEQNLADCNSCIDGYQLECRDKPESSYIIPENSVCFETSNINVLQSLIDSSMSYPNDSLFILDVDEDGFINPFELGEQYWENGSLISINLTNKNLSGSLPDKIDSLSSLQLLILSNNSLSGLIPESICNLGSLNWNPNETGVKSYILNNKFCPPYPECINNFVAPQDTSNCN